MQDIFRPPSVPFLYYASAKLARLDSLYNHAIRALGFPGAVDFTMRSQFGPALSFFKMRCWLFLALFSHLRWGDFLSLIETDNRNGISQCEERRQTNKIVTHEVFSLSQVDCRGDEEGLLACPHTYTTGGKLVSFFLSLEGQSKLEEKQWEWNIHINVKWLNVLAGCDTDTVAGVHCLPTPRQEAASKVLLHLFINFGIF